MSPRSVADVRVEVHVAQKCRSEVLSAASLRSIAQKCCSEVLLRRVAHKCCSGVAEKCRSDMCVELLPELSPRSVAQNRRFRVCVCV